ncbi:hypothetical protein BJ742DRAFT_92309 [Cladochytrium replicatum]|nr:hypothetical protein BJ742DRAFT_92309 [Cladochytrium replicatum]
MTRMRRFFYTYDLESGTVNKAPGVSALPIVASTNSAAKSGPLSEGHVSEENVFHKSSTWLSNASIGQSQSTSTDSIRMSDSVWPQHVPLPAEHPSTWVSRAESSFLNGSPPTESIRDDASLFNVNSINRGVQGAAVWNARTIRPFPKKRIKPGLHLRSSEQHVRNSTYSSRQLLVTTGMTTHNSIDILQRSLISCGNEYESYSVSPRCHATAADRHGSTAILDSDEHSETSETPNFGRHTSFHHAQENLASTGAADGRQILGNEKKKIRLSSLGAPLSSSDRADSEGHYYQRKSLLPVPLSTVPDAGLPAIFGTNTSYALDNSTASIINATAAVTCANTPSVDTQIRTVPMAIDGKSIVSSGEYFATNRVVAMHKAKLANMAALDPFSFTFGDKNRLGKAQRGPTGSAMLPADDISAIPELAKSMISEMPALVDDEFIGKGRNFTSAEKIGATTLPSKGHRRVNNKKKTTRKSGREVVESPGKPSEGPKARKGEGVRQNSVQVNHQQEKEESASNGAKKGRTAFLDSFSKPLIPYRYRRTRFRGGFREDDWMCFFCETTATQKPWSTFTRGQDQPISWTTW